ncbi:MAG: TolC family protein [Calditrichaeota bacterium]|nr:TolC family protein [Calditrichota bacterium]
MRAVKQVWGLSLIILLFSGAGQSQEILNLKNCINLAARNSFQLQADSQQVAAAKNEFLLSRSQTLPQFSGELARTELALQPYHFRQQWASVNGDWSAGSLLLKTYNSSQKKLLSVKARQANTKLQIAHRISQLYISILQKQKNISLFKDRLKLLETHLKITRALWQSGTRTQLDVLQTKSEILRLNEQIAGLQIEAQNFQQELARLLGRKNFGNLQLKPLPLTELTGQDVPELASQNLQTNPRIRALNFQTEAEQMRLRSVFASQLPRVRFNGGYVADGDPTGDGNYWQVTAGIQFPLFQWGATRFQRQKIIANFQSLQFQRKAIERDLSIQAEQKIESLKKLKEIISLQNERLRNNQLANRLAEANYQAGLITNLEFLTVQQQLTETQLELEESGLSYALNLIEFYLLTNQIEKIYELNQ